MGGTPKEQNEPKKTSLLSLLSKLRTNAGTSFVPLPVSLLKLLLFVGSAAEPRTLSPATSVPSEHLSARADLTEMTKT